MDALQKKRASSIRHRSSHLFDHFVAEGLEQVLASPLAALRQFAVVPSLTDVIAAVVDCFPFQNYSKRVPNTASSTKERQPRNNRPRPKN